MTLYKLSLEYQQTAATLRGRITQLEQAYREAADGLEARRLEGRLRPLRSMYRDTRAVALYLERYYQKHVPRRTGRQHPNGSQKEEINHAYHFL